MFVIMDNFLLVAHLAAILDNVHIKEKIRSIDTLTFISDEIK